MEHCRQSCRNSWGIHVLTWTDRGIIPPNSSRSTGTSTLRIATLVLIIALLAGGIVGCMAPMSMLQKKSQSSLTQTPQKQEISLSSDRLSDRTLLMLRSGGWEKSYKGNRQGIIDEMEPWVDLSARPALLFTVAELCFKEGRRLELTMQYHKAMKLYVQCLVYSYRYLFERKFDSKRNSFDPAFRDMCTLYNGASDRILRLIQREMLKEAPKNTALSYKDEISYQLFDPKEKNNQEKDVLNIAMRIKALNWVPQDIAEIQFTTDYNLNRLTNRYRQYGLGLPMMILYKPSKGELVAKYYPAKQYLPATILIRPNLSAFSKQGDKLRPEVQDQPHLVIELYDSVQQAEIELNHKEVPLESDWTTALAASMDDLLTSKTQAMGLHTPDKLMTTHLGDADRVVKGFYMPQQYDPTKIPVILVHGLNSSPNTWLEMYNTLKTIPPIRQKYQIWFYFYPSGQPFWVSASQFRDDLAEIRQTLDPDHTHKIFDNIVLVGHSMGGLVSRMQTIESGDNLWNLVSNESLDNINGSEKLKANLNSWFKFHYNTSISQVIFIGVPQRGSEMANFATRLLGKFGIQQGSTIQESLEEMISNNDTKKADGDFLSTHTNSIDSLSATSPIFPALEKCIKSPYVKYYSIIGQVSPDGKKKTDGVVAYESSHLDNVESELIVDGDHVNLTNNPAVIIEVGRILMENTETLK